ncbi:hypothetical protein EU538_11655 [Candidatus Thorarchaeota archaeon]|nr:MAG: hypothetical protein EU538_11655 [Candidatus Thorarchaeota archaeon]
MAKYRDHPSGEWPFYPRLKDEDIQHEYWRTKKMIFQSFINDRKGRIVLLMEGDKYDAFLEKVKERMGNMWAGSVDAAVHEAIEDWMEKED